MKKIITSPFFTLFTSSSTLLCCALPSLLVALGMGATLVSITSSFPQLIWLSENKNILFIFAGLFLILGTGCQYYSRNQPCPIDPILRNTCLKGRNLSFRILIFSWFIYLLGFTFAYILPHLL